jgi:carboxynorspermidine decarboxylase
MENHKELEMGGETAVGVDPQRGVPLDISLVQTPAYVLEEAKLRANLAVFDRVQKESGAKILLALKGFAFWSVFPWIREVLHGATCSSLNEVRLASEEMQREVHCYQVAYPEREFPEVLQRADHLVFNSFSQWQRFREQIAQAPKAISCGIRVNPGYSEVSTPLYDPCILGSRLGVAREAFRPDELDGIEGLHFHALCGNGSDTLERVVASFEKLYSEFIPRMKWINFGGGHHITRMGYDVERLIRVVKSFRERYGVEVYLEPGEAVGWQTGPLVGSVLDIVHNGMDIAILDVSASAHMPDCLEMPYRPEVRGGEEPGKKPYTIRLGGGTCLAGDVIGDYSFDAPLAIGDKIVFEDMIHYTIVKNTTFNGVALPSLCIWEKERRLRVVREFGYEAYRDRNS